MKKLKDIGCLIPTIIFLVIVAVITIAGTVLSGVGVIIFFKNVVLALGNGNIFYGIILTILVLFGIINSVIGLFYPPQWLNNLFDEIPSWIGHIYAALSMFGTIALVIMFVNIGK